jgi:hypothetical protein
VVQMTHAALASILGPEFDAFLFAPVGEDRNGKLLSVVSALARLDVDPWLEAAKLARLPKEAAIERLTALIASLPDQPWATLSPSAIAARLVALLPRGANSTVPTSQAPIGADPAANPQSIVIVIILALMIAVFWSVAGHAPSAPIDNAHPPAASDSISSPAGPARSGL